MKVVFVQEVKGVGRKGETKDVKPGYARNFLLPQKLAVLPTDSKVKEISEEIKIGKAKKAEAAEKNEQVISLIEGKTFRFSAKTDKKGKLYGSIGPKEIAKKLGIAEEKIAKHFKEIGKFPLELNFESKKVTCYIEIEPEKE